MLHSRPGLGAVVVSGTADRVGFIGLGNVGGKLAGSLLRNGIDLTVRDLDRAAAQRFLDGSARWADSPRELAEQARDAGCPRCEGRLHGASYPRKPRGGPRRSGAGVHARLLCAQL